MPKTVGRYEMDMTKGPILVNMIRFAIPLMFSTILQLFYNAADMIVVGRFAGPTALAAVGSTGAISSLFINLFMGLSVGTSVTVAQHYGAHEHKDVSETVHTTVTLALLSGIGISIAGISLSRPLLQMMSTPEEVLDYAVLYMRIIFAGMPANLLYNFSAAVLRAVGDTKRPLYFLTIAGLVNVALNLVFVIFFRMSVAGVALATIISQMVSATLVILCLVRSHGSIHLDVRKLALHKDKVKKIAVIGFPAGLQSSMFSISNTLIQSSVNSFGAIAMAGNTTASNIESFVSSPLDAFSQATMSAVGQCYGAKKPERIHKIVRTGMLLVAVMGITVGGIALLTGGVLPGLYTSDPAVIDWAMRRMRIMVMSFWISSVGGIGISAMRATGYSFVPMLISIMAICVFRIVWIYTAFAMYSTPTILYLSYPISYVLSTVAQFTCYGFRMKKVVAGLRAEQAA